ncbi:MAG: hypothetical protein R2852_02630 [Bacteroidia bacterium]
MKSRIYNKLLLQYAYLILIFLTCCNNNLQMNEQCSKFENEIYQNIQIDSASSREVLEFQKYLFTTFDESSIKGLNNEAYLLQFYSSHGYGESVKFEKKNGGGLVSIKCKNKKDIFEDCFDYQIKISSEEWDILEKMIYEFNFWVADDFGVKRVVLDGSAYLLEGNRPEAKKCNKKIYKLVSRISPQYDKMGALCNNILEYAYQLEFKYQQNR